MHDTLLETQNAVFFQNLGMSLMASDNEEAARFADRIVYDGKTGEKIMAAQREHMITDGSERIAQIISEKNN